MNICIFGDSIAYGAFDQDLGGWVNRLRLYLESRNFDGEVYNLGISGDNSSGLLERLDKELGRRIPATVVIAIGINDSQYLSDQKINRIDLVKFESNIIKTIDKVKNAADELLFVGLTPVDEDKTNPIPWDGYKVKCYKNEHIKKYDQKIKDICRERGGAYHIDLFEKFINQPGYKELFYDGLHPNADGHKLMFEIIKKSIELLL